jgi:glutamine amidotransferase
VTTVTVRTPAEYEGRLQRYLFERSEEDGAKGLAVLPGTVRRLEGAPRLPHIGWNQLELRRHHPLLSGIADGAACYFVHSYAGLPEDSSVVLTETEHGRRFVSAIGSGPLLGVQFHPERSGDDGLRLLANYVELVRDGR